MEAVTNTMRKIRIDKITLNIGAGKNTELLEKGVKLLTELTGIPPVKTITNKRIPTWGLRPGLPIGCKLTLRGDKGRELLVRLLKAKENKLTQSQFDDNGNISFGIHEYIDVPGAKYNPEIGIIGFQVCVTLQRPGFRVKRRRLRSARLCKTHNIMKEDSMNFMAEEFGVKVAGEDE